MHKGGRTKQTYHFHQKGVSLVLIVALLMTQIIHITPVYGDPEKTKVNLVAILVEEGLINNQTTYDGLKNYPPASTLSDRIKRYALDIQQKLENTKVTIVTVNKNDDPYEISKVLEKLYFEGDGTSNEINNLEGIVLIGNVPLPTVRKQAHTYKSIYPYVDFIDQEFLYDPSSKIFEENKTPGEKQAEIWHGVIKPPASGEDGNKLLAMYFDKNHAFYASDPNYTTFDQKVFFADLLHEADKLNSDKLKSYQAFLDHMEDIIYMRFNKKLAKEITDTTTGDINARIASANVNMDIFQKRGSSNNNENPYKQVPDIFTRDIIMRMISRFSQLFGDYPGQVEQWVSGSGRWPSPNDNGNKGDDTFMSLITTKDEFSMRILKKANDVMEAKTDEIANQLQSNITIETSAEFMRPGWFGPDIQRFHNYINGQDAAAITKARQCTLYRGSSSNQPYAQQVEANRVYNPVNSTATDPGGYNDLNNCDPFGGCCGKNINFQNGQLAKPLPGKCNPLDATLPVVDIRGTLKVPPADPGIADYRACLVPPNYPEQKGKYINYTKISGSEEEKSIPSVIYHKEPTGNTITAQLFNKVSQYLPIDQPRYVDFQNSAGQYQRINYLNLFNVTKDKSATVDNAKNAVTDILNSQGTLQNDDQTTYQKNIASYKSYLSWRLGLPVIGKGLTAFNTIFQTWKTQSIDLLKTQSGASYPDDQRFRYVVDYIKAFAQGQMDHENDLQTITTNLFPFSASYSTAREDISITSHNYNTLSSFIKNGGDTITVTITPKDANSNTNAVTMSINMKAVDTPPNEEPPAQEPDQNGNIAFAAYPFDTSPESVYTKALQEKGISLDTLSDAIHWRYLTINDKYKYIFENYLSTSKTAGDGSYQDIYPTKRKGYESLYLNMGGTDKFLSFAIPKNNITDEQFNTIDAQNALTDIQNKTTKSLQSIQKKITTMDASCGSYDGVDLWQWFSAIQCWLKSLLPPKLTFETDDGKNTVDFSTPSSSTDPFTPPAGTNENQNNTPGEQILSHITLDSTATNLNLIDQTSPLLTATVLDQNGEAYLPTTEMSLQFKIQQGDTVIRLDQSDVPMQNGTASTTLTPLTSGTATIIATMGTITSDPLTIHVYDKKINIGFTQTGSGAIAYGSSLPARSIINISADIVDPSGTTVAGNGTIHFEIKNKDHTVDPSFPSASTGNITNGQGSVPIFTGAKAGNFTLFTTANIDGELLSSEEPISVVGNTPSQILIKGQSNQVVNGHTTNVALIVTDQDGNPVVGTYDVSLFLNENGTTSVPDNDQTKDGINTTIQNDAQLIFPVQATKTGTLNIKAHIDGIDQDASLSLSVIDSATITFTSSPTTIPAGSTQDLPVTIQLRDGNGQPADISDTVEITTNNDLGTFSPSTVSLLHGKGTTLFQAGTKAGEMQVGSKTYPSQPFVLTVLPGNPQNVSLTSDVDTLQADGKDKATIIASVRDEYGNIVTPYNGTISLAITDLTKPYGTLSYSTVNATNGTADFDLSSTPLAGEIHLIATVDNGTISSGDQDGDGVPDNRDLCPFEPGPAMNKGCPLTTPPSDKDGDGIPDTLDQCPTLSGLPENGGCPKDTPPDVDGDGVPDTIDQCPTIAGPASNHGCPPWQGTLIVKTEHRIDADTLKNMSFNSLYTTLLGSDAGNVTREGYLGGWMLFNPGKIQAVTSLIAPATQLKEFATISNQGMALSAGDPDRNFKTAVRVQQDKPIAIDVYESNTSSTYLTTYIEPDKNVPFFLVPDKSAATHNGIYIIDDNLSDDITVAQEGNTMVLKQGESTVGTIFPGGYISLSPSLSIALSSPDATSSYTFTIMNGDAKVADLIYQLGNLSVTALSGSEGIDAVPGKGPGIYVSLLHPDYQLTSKDGSISLTKAGEVDTINEPFISVEDSGQEEAVGWKGDFKNELLFAAGNSVGDSTKLYGSSLLINLGDPVIALPQNNTTGTLGYTQDIGKLLASYQNKTIQQIVPIDYNNDKQKDLLVVLTDGTIDLLQNFNNGQDFKNMGTILQIQDGIQSIAAGDINGDGWEDLVLVTKTGKVAELINTGGTFVRHNLTLNVQGKITDIKLADMDQDGKLDLTTSDDSGDINIFYGNGTGFDATPLLVGNLGIHVSSENLNHEPYVYYDTLPPKSSTPVEGTADEITNNNSTTSYTSLPYDSAINTNSDPANSNTNSPGMKDFMRLDLVTPLQSEKSASDINGGTLQPGDDVQYTIKITSASSIPDLAIADVIPPLLDFQTTSLTCENCGDHFTLLSQANVNYPLFIGHIQLTGGVTATITYKTKVKTMPGIALEVGKFGSPPDNVLDIFAHMANEGTGQAMLYSSIGARQYDTGVMKNGTFETPQAAQDAYNQLLQDENGNTLQANGNVNASSIPKFVKDQMKSWTGDTNHDGIPNAWDEYNDTGGSIDSMVDSTRATIDNVMQTLCGSGGCLNLPINMAFLSPGYFTIPWFSTSGSGWGTTIEIQPKKIARDEGYPIFGVTSTTPYVCTGASCYATAGQITPVTCDPVTNTCTPPSVRAPDTSVFRVFLSPTLTGGLGFALCWNSHAYGMIEVPPNPAVSNCVWMAVPLAQMVAKQACTSINASMNNLVPASKSMHIGSGMSVFQVGTSAQNTGTGKSSIQFDNGVFTSSAVQFNNQRPPSFPGFIMDWVDRQVDHIQQMLTRLPSIYLILPDFRGVLQSPPVATTKTSIKYIGDVLDYMNTLPFINLRMQDVVIKYPWMSKERIDQLVEYFNQWVKNAESEIARFQHDITSGNILKLRLLQRFIARVKSNLQTLQAYVNFEKYIQMLSQWKTALIRQVLTYLNRIVDVMGGYYIRNKLRVVKWVELFMLIKKILESWQLLPKLFLDYRNRCTTCTNDRGNSMHWRLSLAQYLVPSLPDIPFPKWPDIVLDVSNINAVINIDIPNFKILPQEIVLPRLPSFRLPDIAINADLDVMIPKLPPLPDLSKIFPKLPPLPIPKLPDIPPPPKIPKLLGFLQPILKILDLALYIWCLYKQAFPLAQEWELKSKIEDRTQRSGFLPLDFISLSIPVPVFAFVDQIRISTFVHFKFDVTLLVDIARSIANTVNKIETNLINGASNAIQNAIPKDVTPPPINKSLNDARDQIRSTAQQWQTEKDQFVTGDEMRNILLDQIKNLSDVRSSPTLSTIEKSLQQAMITTPDTTSTMTVPVNKKNKAMEQTLLSMLQNATKDETTIARAITQHQNLLAVGELKNWFPPAGTILASSSDQTVSIQTTQTMNNFSPPPASLSQEQATAPLLAANTSGTQKTTDTSTADITAPSVSLRGLYVYNNVSQTYEKLIAYSGGDSGTSLLTTFDADADGAEDIVYTLNGDIFLKENKTNAPENQPHISTDPALEKLADWKVSLASIIHTDISTKTNGATISWSPDLSSTVVGYRIVLKPVINRFDLEKVRNFNETTTLLYVPLKGEEDRVKTFITNDPGTVSTLTEGIDPTDPSLTISLPNGNYYGKIQSIASDGTLGTQNEIHLAAPQPYGDNTPPIALVAGGNTKEIPILQTLTLDASPSKDTEGKVVSYWWDLDPNKDSDGDGQKTNDADYSHCLTTDQNANMNGILSQTPCRNDPLMTIGPFTDPGEKRIYLNVSDDAGNVDQQEIIIHVTTPKLSIDSASIQNHTIQGKTDGPVSNEPFQIIRERNGKLSMLKTPSADTNGFFHTDQNGGFSISDMHTNKGVVLKDAQGNIVATINEESGNITLKDSQYMVKVSPSTDTAHTTIAITKNGETITSFTIVPDPNGDVLVTTTPPAGTPQTLTVVDTNMTDTIQFSSLPESAPSFPGGAAIYDAGSNTLLAMVGTNGDIRLLDNTLSLALKPVPSDNAPLTLEILKGQNTIGEITFPLSSHFTINPS